MESRQTKIMVFGTFDIFHKGHENLFKQARRLAKYPYLIVSIARDVNVKKIKGRKPKRTENARLKFLSKHPLVDKAVLGGKQSHLAHILKEKPEIIALGFDQKVYTQNLQQDLKKRGLEVKIKRLKPYKRHLYRSSLLK